jgi:hypothetical protein
MSLVTCESSVTLEVRGDVTGPFRRPFRFASRSSRASSAASRTSSAFPLRIDWDRADFANSSFSIQRFETVTWIRRSSAVSGWISLCPKAPAPRLVGSGRAGSDV